MESIILLIAMGLMFIVAAIAILIKKINLVKNGGRTTAIVIKTKRRIMGGMGNGMYRFTGTYIPVLEYTVNGQTHIKEYPHGSARPKYNYGHTFEVMYCKNNPEKMMIVGDNLQYIGSTISLVIGFAMLGVGLSQLLF